MRNDRARLEDMLEMCGLVREEVASDEQRFRRDPVLQAAAQRWLEIVGEAAARLSPELRDHHTNDPWATKPAT